jgi:hypothetical protein
MTAALSSGPDPNRSIIVDHDGQRDHLLISLGLQLLAVSNTLMALSQKAADPTYDQAKVDELVEQQVLIEARIEEIKADGPFKYPSDAEVSALGKACDALNNMDVQTCAATALIDAANKVVAALPLSSTK